MRRTALLNSTISICDFLLPVMVLLACSAAMAQSPTYKVGRTPTAAELHEWDKLVGSDGKELPPGSGSAKEGAPIYAAKCAVCHGKNGEGIPPFRRLVGGIGTLNTPTPKITVGSYAPFATTIWEYINRAMPRLAERTLSPDEVYALTAWVLYKNDIIKETDVLDKNTLLEVQMPNRNGFYPVPPQATPDKDRSWFPYWNQAPGWKPAAK
ncbi:MAG: cytochrome c [Acidobacteriia bacterium]|nr:cytochrome c [Terriglobia bacterium]